MSENLFIPPSLFNSGLSWRARLLYVDLTNLAVDNYLFPSHPHHQSNQSIMQYGGNPERLTKNNQA